MTTLCPSASAAAFSLRVARSGSAIARQTARAGIMLVVAMTAWGSATAAPLTLSIVVRTNDLAPGSRARGDLPDGIFSSVPYNVNPEWSFGPPAAAAGGFFSFGGAAQVIFPNNSTGIVPGVWVGSGQGLTALGVQGHLAPGLDTNFTHFGLMNVSELGQSAYFADTAAAAPNGGLWWGHPASGTLDLVQRLNVAPVFGTIRPLQTSNYIAFAFQNTNWVYNTQTRELRAVSFPGMSVSAFGNGVVLSTAGTIIALTDRGQLLLQANAETNRVFLANGPDDVVPVLAQGDPAPGLANRRIGLMQASGNDRGGVAVLVSRLDDGDLNQFNDRSALFAGPATNIGLIAQSPFGQIWGGGTFISRSNHVIGANTSGAMGIYKLSDSPNGSPTFTPLPPYPYPSLSGNLTFASLNALGQYAILYANSSHPNQKNRGIDLWLYNPGDGWTNVARAGSNLVASGQSIPVNAIGFLGSYTFPFAPAGGGHATGLTDDGKLFFTINGTQIVSADTAPRYGFVFNGAINSNWHSTTNNPPSNWEDTNGFPRTLPPGDAEPGTAEVTIPDTFVVTVDARPTSIGKLTVRDALLFVNTNLVVNGFYEATEAHVSLYGTLQLKGGGRLGEMRGHVGSYLEFFAPDGGETYYEMFDDLGVGGGFGEPPVTTIGLFPGATVKLKRQRIYRFDFVAMGGGSVESDVNDISGSEITTKYFVWRDGTIGSAAEITRFRVFNKGVIAPGMFVKRLAGTLNISGFFDPTIQQDHLLLDSGHIIVDGIWIIDRSCRIDGLGDSDMLIHRTGHGNGSLYLGDPDDPGDSPVNAVIDVPFDNRGDVHARGPDGSSLAFTAGVRQRSGTTLTEGMWEASPDNTIEIPGAPFETIGKKAILRLHGNAGFPLSLRRIEGAVELGHNRNESTPGDLIIDRKARLALLGSAGHLNVAGVVRNFGTLTVASGYTLDAQVLILHAGVAQIDGTLACPVSIRGGTLRGKVLVTDRLDNESGVVHPDLGTMTVGEAFSQAAAGTMAMQVAGAASGQFSQLNVSNSAALGGALVINLTGDFRPQAGDTFPLLVAQTISGQFANASNGQRISTVDGYGSFQVNYTPTAVVLGDFSPNPNPLPTAPATLQPPEFVPGQALELNITGSPGRPYILQGSSNLVDWTSVFTNVVGFDGQLSFEVPVAADEGQFFRAMAQ